MNITDAIIKKFNDKEIICDSFKKEFLVHFVYCKTCQMTVLQLINVLNEIPLLSSFVSEKELKKFIDVIKNISEETLSNISKSDIEKILHM